MGCEEMSVMEKEWRDAAEPEHSGGMSDQLGPHQLPTKP